MADERVRFVLSADDQTRGAFSSVRSNIEGVAQSLRGFSTLGGGILGAVALGELRQAGTALLDARISAEKLTNTLTQAVGASGLRSELQFIRDQAGRLGLEFDSTAASYAKFAAAGRGTTLEGQQTREIFIGIAQASTALGLSSEETAGALTAVQQIISKNKVSAEELRGQLGERLPGAFQIAARSIGKTTQELDALLQTGSLTADEFLPRFARQLQTEFSDASARAADSTQASVNKLTSSWNNLKRTLGEGIAGDTIQAGLDQTTGAIDNLSRATKEVERNSQSWLGSLIEITRLLPALGTLRNFGQLRLDGEQAGRTANETAYSQFQADALRQFPPRPTLSGVRALDNAQTSAFDQQARADVRKLLDQFRTPEQKLQNEIAELRRLGALTGQDVTGAIAEARRRAAGATVDMAKAYEELDAKVRQADLDDQLEREAKAADAAATAFRDYVGLLGQIAGNERDGAEKALSPDLAGWQRVADLLREIRGTDSSARTRDAALKSANELLDAGAITFDEYEKLGSKILDLKDPVAKVAASSRDILLPIQSAFEEALLDGKKLSDVVSSLARDVAQIFLRQQLTAPLAEALGGAFGGDKKGGTLFDALRGIFGFAGGGYPPVGRLSLVGERGPELIMPRTPTTIVPLGSGVGGATIVQNFDMRNSAVTENVVRAAAALGAAQARSSLYDDRVRGKAIA
ncbi:MAG: tape measure protein [Burkholderiaceae bacterium]|nr:tape measure protein [Burkholderiaceae bacterium]